MDLLGVFSRARAVRSPCTGLGKVGTQECSFLAVYRSVWICGVAEGH